jgi:subtilisin family serine protease
VLVRIRRGLGSVLSAAAVVATLFSVVAAGASQAASGNAASGNAAEHVPGRLLVSYQPGTTPDQAAAAESAAGAHLSSTIDALGVRVLAMPADRTDHALAALSRNPHVGYVEYDFVARAAAVTPNDPYWSKQWGSAKTMTNTAWTTSTGSSSVVVAVLDTGVDYNHADLKGAFSGGYDFVNNDSTPADDYGHGTEVAGVIAARGNNGIGVAGECWTCTIMPVKVLNSSGSGSYSGIVNGITYAADHGARIINMSLGGTAGSSTLQNAVNYAWNKGVLLIAAAGNAGTTDFNYPGAYDPVVAVAASDSRDARYSWSSYGSWVEVAAPGCDETTALGGGYAEPCGTSFASPMTAGIAALMASANSSASNATLRNALINNTDSVGSYVIHGRVNASKALAAVGSSAPAPAPSSPAPSSTTFSGSLTKQSMSRSFTVTTSGGAFSASLSFARASSLSVTVKSSSGTVVAQGTGPSVLHLTGSVSAGTYTFTVTGTERSSFDLAVSYTA